MSKVLDKERHIKFFRITPEDSADVKFEEHLVIEADTEPEPKRVKIPLSAKPPFRVHSDLTSKLKMLRKPLLAAMGIELADPAKQMGNWAIPAIKIKGDVLTKQSRVTMYLAIFVQATGKVSEMECPEWEMYPEDVKKSKCPQMEQMAPIIEEIIDEILQYLEGKNGDYLPLFASESKETQDA